MRRRRGRGEGTEVEVVEVVKVVEVEVVETEAVGGEPVVARRLGVRTSQMMLRPASYSTSLRDEASVCLSVFDSWLSSGTFSRNCS